MSFSENSMAVIMREKDEDVERDLRSQGPVDVLTQMLESVHLRSKVTPATFKGAWNLEVESGPGRFYILTGGKCWLEMKGGRCPVFLVRGDLVFIPQGQAHRLGDSVDEEAIATQGLGDEREPVTMVCGSFVLEEDGFEPLFSALSPLIYIRGEDREHQSGLEDLLRVVIHEASSAGVKSPMIINRLVHILFIQAIRSCGSAVIGEMRGNLLAGLMDPQIGLAIRWMNQKPESPWTVASLAEKVCMSRSVFAARFTSLVGQPPLRYLHQCRMNKACALLRETPKGIKKIANSIGYSSEAAFSNAFKRWIGRSPGQYRGVCRLG